MTVTTASVGSGGGTRVEGRNQSAWRKFLDAVLDLPPEVWIELERRHLGP